jgi:CBS domain-containing protein
MTFSDEHLDDELQQMQESEGLKSNIHTAIDLSDPITKLRLQKTVAVPHDTLVQTAIDEMKTKRTGCILVTQDEKLVGIFTERDVVRRVYGKETDVSKDIVADYMTKTPDTLKPESPIAFALNLMAQSGYRHVPLIDDAGHPQGFVSVRDIVNYVGDYFTRDLLNLPPQPQDDAWTSVEGG